MKKLILRSWLSPGDVMTMTAALESLHNNYPGEYLTDVRTPVPEIWENNPLILQIDGSDEEVTAIDLEYPAIHQSNSRPVTFIEAYTEFLGDKLGRPMRATVNKPVLYLSKDEMSWINQIVEHVSGGRPVPYWVINAGTKFDFTAKQWPIESYQEVVDRTRGRVQWVQIGNLDHDHEKLSGVIDLRGQTTTRQLIRLVYHACGGLGPVTFLQHLCAAWNKPYICMLGGREPLQWVQYPFQHTMHSMGMLPCCRDGACWKSRVVKLNDNAASDGSLCNMPVFGLKRPVGKCMAMIKPDDVVAVIERILSA